MPAAAITARALEIAHAQFEAPTSAWARRSVRPSDPEWTREAIIRRFFWAAALAQPEREAADDALDRYERARRRAGF